MSKLFPSAKTEGASNDIDHQLLVALINNMSEAVLALDSAGKIILTNSVALNILDTNALNGASLKARFDLIDKKGLPIDLQQRLLEQQTPIVSSDWRLRFHDGSLMNLYISASPVRLTYSAAGRQGGYVVIFRDITKEKTIEEERNDFISVASHELRTPVAIVEGNVGNAMVLAEKGGAPDSVKQSLAAAHDQALFLGSLINDLAMLSRAERGKLALNVEAFDVAEMIESLTHDYEPQSKLKNLSLVRRIEPEVGQLVSSQLYVREMLQNFITNAIKYTEKGEVSLTARQKEGGVEFEISDTGMGIKQSEQSRLFSKFFRSDDWRVRKVNGTGLGLYVTAKLAKLLGANIQMRSQLNHGTSFRLYVPDFNQPA